MHLLTSGRAEGSVRDMTTLLALIGFFVVAGFAFGLFLVYPGPVIALIVMILLIMVFPIWAAVIFGIIVIGFVALLLY